MIGCTPAARQASEKASAPNMLPRSAMATAGICQARQVSTSSSSLIAPSSSE